MKRLIENLDDLAGHDIVLERDGTRYPERNLPHPQTAPRPRHLRFWPARILAAAFRHRLGAPAPFGDAGRT